MKFGINATATANKYKNYDSMDLIKSMCIGKSEYICFYHSRKHPGVVIHRVQRKHC